MSKEPSELPEGWVWTTFDGIQQKIEKVKPKGKNPDETFLYVDIGCLDKNKITKWKKYTWGTAPSRAQQIIKTDDVLFSTVRTYLKNIALVKDTKLHHQICSSGFTVIRGFTNHSLPNYLFYYVITDDFIQSLNKLQTGTSYPAVRDRDIFIQPLPLPPLPEQHALAEIIEEKFSNLDNGISELKKAQEQLKLYRQSVLKSAFEGKLTRDWRQEHEDELEPAEKLLMKIKVERENQYKENVQEWEQEVKDWKEAGKDGRKPRKPKKPKELPPLTQEELEGLGGLPRGWVWVRISEVAEVNGGNTPKKLNENSKSGNIPFYKVSDMNREGNNIWMKNSAIYLTEAERNAMKIKLYKSGTIIFPKRGGAILTNKKRRLKKPSSYDLNIMGVIERTHKLSNDYLWYWFSKLDLRTLCDGSNIPQINNKNINPLLFPLPPLPEQHQIVQEIESRLSVADKLKQTINDALQKAEALRQSILKSAFQGKLTEKWREENPELITGENSAQALLEKVRKEKEKAGPRGRGRGRTRRRKRIR